MLMVVCCVSSAGTSMAMQRPTVADFKKAVAPAIALANALIVAPAFAEGTGEVLPAEYCCLSWHCCTLRCPVVEGVFCWRWMVGRECCTPTG